MPVCYGAWSPFRIGFLLLSALGSLSAAAAVCVPNCMPMQEPVPAQVVDLPKPPTEDQGDVLLLRGRYLAAIQVFSALEPKTAPILNKRGIANEHMQIFPQARADFEEAIRRDPKFAEAYNNLATVFHAQGDFRKAEKLYKKAIHLKAGNADAYQNLGALYFSMGKYRKGDAAYKQALALDPGILEHSVRNAIQTNSDRKSVLETHYHLAETYAQAGSRLLALEYLRKAIAEGFHDRKRLLHDEAFANLRTTPDFLKMVDDLRSD